VSGSQVINVNADPSILQTVAWDFITDGISNGEWSDIQAFIDR
jgi:hypothetical protein